MFDSHLHIIDPRFPLVANAGYLPEAFTVADYLRRVRTLGVTGGAVVSGSFQAFDQSYLVDALERLGPGFVGVTQLPATASDRQILDLDTAGVRAVRFNLYRGGSEGPAQLDRLARRVFDLAGWHTELYVDAADLPGLEPVLTALPKVSIDHLGMSEAGRGALLRLVDAGLRVKATGFGRVRLDVPATLRAIHTANPGALMAGTDLPSTRAARPFAEADLGLLADTLGEEATEAVLVTNARDFYGVGA